MNRTEFVSVVAMGLSMCLLSSPAPGQTPPKTGVAQPYRGGEIAVVSVSWKGPEWEQMRGHKVKASPGAEVVVVKVAFKNLPKLEGFAPMATRVELVDAQDKIYRQFTQVGDKVLELKEWSVMTTKIEGTSDLVFAIAAGVDLKTLRLDDVTFPLEGLVVK